MSNTSTKRSGSSGDRAGPVAFEKALAESEERYRAVVQQVSEAIFLLDPDTMRLLEANLAFQNLFGYGADEIPGLSLYDLLPYERERVDRTTRRAFEEGEYHVGDRLYRRKDGSLVDVEVGITLISYGGRRVLCEVIRDITERKKLEQRKDDFIALASHELSTPVTSLKLFARSLRKRFEREEDSELAQHGVKQLRRMDEQVDRLARLVRSLLDVSRIEAGRLNYSLGEVDLDELLQEAVEDLRRLSDRHELVLESPHRVGARLIAPLRSTTVIADKERIGQVMTNLVMNAIKYSPQGGRIIISSEIDEEKDEAIVSVQDFGIGIPESAQQRVFERFFQVGDLGDVRAAGYPGLGLGLFICAEIISRHGGRIWVESQLGEGSTFRFTLLTGLANPSPDTYDKAF